MAVDIIKVVHPNNITAAVDTKAANNNNGGTTMAAVAVATRARTRTTVVATKAIGTRAAVATRAKTRAMVATRARIKEEDRSTRTQADLPTVDHATKAAIKAATTTKAAVAHAADSVKHRTNRTLRSCRRDQST